MMCVLEPFYGSVLIGSAPFTLVLAQPIQVVLRASCNCLNEMQKKLSMYVRIQMTFQPQRHSATVEVSIV